MTDIPLFWVALAIVALILLTRWWRSRKRFGIKTTGWGVDVERDLVRACRGDTSMAERLIQHEIDRKPESSRTAAALMALARLRDDAR